MGKDTSVIDFGKKEFIELMIPMTLFILIVSIVTCIVAIYEACKLVL